MKRLLLITGFWPTKQNPISGIFVVQQINALCNAGCEVTVVVARTVGKAGNHLSLTQVGLKEPAARLVAISVPRLPEKWSANPLALKLNIFLTGISARRILAPLLPTMDGCIVHGIRYFGLALPKWGRGYMGRTLLFIHGVDPFIEREGLVSRIAAALRRSDRSISNYVLVGSPLKKHAANIGVDPEKLVVIPNGTEIPGRSADRLEGSRPERIAIISVSNLVPLKGIDDNIRALALLRRRDGLEDWTYTVVGDGPERARLQKIAIEVGVEDKIRFLGRLRYEDTMHEIAKADIFSLPSWGEAFGIVYLEAMARFIPVIGCLENGAADVIADGEDGLLVPPRNPEALALAFTRLIENREFRAELGRRARQTAEGFTWDINAGRVLKHLGLQ